MVLKEKEESLNENELQSKELMKEIRALKEKIKMKEEEWLEKDNACKDLQGKLNGFGDIIKESD